MTVEYMETDVTDETTIKWYSVDGVAYGITSDGKILDSDGIPLVDDGVIRQAIESNTGERQ